MRYKAVILFLCLLPVGLYAQHLFDLPKDVESRWISFENPTGAKGRGGMENKGAKGDASRWIRAGDSIVLADIHGAGIINRIWMTIIDRNPRALRSIVLKIWWDGAKKPAVSAPLGDFFGIGLGRMTAFQSALFADPEGRSFNCFIPMPYKKGAKVVFINASQQDQLLFYDIDYSLLKTAPQDIGYFHAYWSNNDGAKPGQDFEILPRVKGKGRFLGVNLSVVADSIYGNTWFGEGEVKTYLDNDGQYPTLVGSGTEDYIGSAWNLGPFNQLYSGAPIVDKTRRQYAFYRYHIPDPIYFQQNCKVTIQQIGGAGRDLIRGIIKAGGQAKAISVMTSKGLIKLLERPDFPDVFDDKFPADEWVNFYRVDDYSATAYFYLDKPENDLPALVPLAKRLKGL